MNSTNGSAKGYANRPLIAFLTCLLACTVAETKADPIIVPNFSFDLPSTGGDGGFVNGAPTGWTGSGVLGGVFNPLDSQFPGSTGGDVPAPADGQNVAYLGDGSSFGSNSFTTTAPLTSILANSTYTLTVALGSRLDLPADLTDVALLQFVANDVVLAEGSLIFNLGESTIPSGTFTDFTTSLIIGPSSPLIGQDLKVQIFYQGDRQLMIDNVRMDVVPEPSTAALFIGGVVLAAALRRREK